ncbi:MAG: pyridoxal 5'-phosphate synthase glutaminase subunit PdxT [Actinobacteria bacterium]|nr:pyridoxal 5'-phosphate synthase glutaminase subunit PdxT [Actinomycetota bacterium]
MAGSSKLRIGVLALQGDVREHMGMLEQLDVEAVPVRREIELARVDGLIIPGGESSVMDKLARAFDLNEPLKTSISSGLPVFGTCAGLIMLAKNILDAIDGQQSLGGLDVDVRRNAFGAQVDSFEVEVDAPAFADTPLAAAFIRAPVVERVGDDVDVLASLSDGRVVGVQQGNALGISFHPEVCGEFRVHEYFLKLVRNVA